MRAAEDGALTPEDFAPVQQQVGARVLRWVARAGLLDLADARGTADISRPNHLKQEVTDNSVDEA